MRRLGLMTAGLLVVAGCSGERGASSNTATESESLLRGADAISSETLADWTRTLASDEFGGRGPSSPGEERTVTFLRDEFQALGLEPGNGDSWYQDVPLVELTVRGTPELSFTDGHEAFVWGDEFVGGSKRVVESTGLEESEMVFVGYGIVAPEYGWNDYEGVDAAGKTVVMLVNDPGFATGDPTAFRADTMTYYGRWTYKFEEAARQGAAGALLIHDTEPAGYGWDVVRGGWTGPQFDLADDSGNMGRVAVEAWAHGDAAARLFTSAGHDLAALSEAAARPGFRAIPLGVAASVSIESTVRESRSRNVLAVLPGTDRADEYIVFMAHWDHFGTSADPDLVDPIYNGAKDNATGTAGLLEMAKAFGSLEQRPSRSVLFLAVTAEEQGLLGSAYYAANPTYPTHKTVAALNMDVLNTDGPMNDIVVIGYGNSELDEYAAAAAARQGRSVQPDAEPEKGFYYRSDHFSFAKAGVPALNPDPGTDHVDHGMEWTMSRREDYTANRYHKPSDEFDESWDWSGAVDDVRWLFDIGHALATSDAFPNWREGNEFRALRDADLAAAR